MKMALAGLQRSDPRITVLSSWWNLDTGFASAECVEGHYHILTRSDGALHILSPGLTSNAFINASLFTSGTKARYGPGECAFDNKCGRNASSRYLIHQIC